MLILALLACTKSASDDTGPSGDGSFTAEVWADNWSSMYIGDSLVMEDSTPITTERSFNEEVFSFAATRPVQINTVLKDYMETESGLEYIGEQNQQMGDGGYIAQFTDNGSGEIVAVSSSEWRCLTLQEAPLNKDCEDDADPDATCEHSSTDEPEGWMDADFDDSAWPNATEYSATAVDPKDGYDTISWDSGAAFIWGSDLESHNTLICRFTLE